MKEVKRAEGFGDGSMSALRLELVDGHPGVVRVHADDHDLSMPAEVHVNLLDLKRAVMQLMQEQRRGSPRFRPGDRIEGVYAKSDIEFEETIKAVELCNGSLIYRYADDEWDYVHAVDPHAVLISAR